MFDNPEQNVWLGKEKRLKKLGFVATNTAGNSPRVSFKISALVATNMSFLKLKC